MSQREQKIERRKLEALEVFEKFPGQVPLDLQKKVLAQQVDIGMDPYMARLAGGDCFFKVTADQTKWPPGSHPQRVMDAQSLHPDASEIWLTFENDTQFPDLGLVRFQVYLKYGRVSSITIVSP